MIEGSELEEAALRLSDTRKNSYFVNKVYPAFSIKDLRQDLINKARSMALNKNADHEWGGWIMKDCYARAVLSCKMR